MSPPLDDIRIITTVALRAEKDTLMLTNSGDV